MSGPESHGEWVWVREFTSVSKAILSSPRYILWLTHTSQWGVDWGWILASCLLFTFGQFSVGTRATYVAVASARSESVWGWDEPGL